MFPMIFKAGLAVAVALVAAYAAYAYHESSQQQEGHRWAPPPPPHQQSPPPPQRSVSPSRRPTRRKHSRGSSQKEILTDELNNGTAECSICLTAIRPNQSTYSCEGCRQFFHLKCSECWAEQSEDGLYFKCPHCFTRLPKSSTRVYKCMCGRTLNPSSLPGLTPHCCEQSCPKCYLPCHPGHCD